jgi:hypothetical protein
MSDLIRLNYRLMLRRIQLDRQCRPPVLLADADQTALAALAR